MASHDHCRPQAMTTGHDHCRPQAGPHRRPGAAGQPAGADAGEEQDQEDGGADRLPQAVCARPPWEQVAVVGGNSRLLLKLCSWI